MIQYRAYWIIGKKESSNEAYANVRIFKYLLRTSMKVFLFMSTYKKKIIAAYATFRQKISICIFIEMHIET